MGRFGLRHDLKKSVPAYLMIAPTIIIFLIFLYVPFVNAIRISFYDYNGISGFSDFIWLENYIHVLTDRNFYNALLHTVQMMAVDMIFATSIGFTLAYMLYRKVPGAKVFNVILFIPYLISMVVVGNIWIMIYDPVIGPINQILEAVGLEFLTHAWLGEPSTALPAIMFTWVWRAVPFKELVLYANILKIPPEMLEAAEVDGATTRQRLFYIIIPYLKPTIISLLMLAATTNLRAFDMIWTMTMGGPGGASDVITSYVYRTAFQSNRFGVATTMSLCVMVIMVSLIMVQNALKARSERRGQQ